MKKGANGIHPLVAILLTLAVGAVTVLCFSKGRIFWGVVLALITADFFADVVLSFKKGSVE